MKRYIFSLLFTLTSITTITFDVLAQEAAAPAEDDIIGVYNRGRPDYTPDGVRLGNFLLHAGGAVDYLNNSNIYADDVNETSDNIFVYRPMASLESDWNNHKLKLGVDAAIGQYTDNSDENYEDVNVNLDSTLNILAGHDIDINGYYSEKHEDRFSPNAAFGIEPTTYSQTGGSVWYSRNTGKIKLKVGGGADNFSYDDGVKVVTPTTTAKIDNSTRDMSIYKARARVGYEIVPNYEAFIEGGYNAVQYDKNDPTIPAAGGSQNRDSTGYDVVLGTAVNITGKIKGEVYGGYQTADYENNSLSDIGNFKYGGSLLYDLTKISTLKASVDQSIQETTLASASGYTSTTGLLRLEHELKRNILLAADTSYTVNSFKDASDREDDITGVGAEAVYLFRKGLNLTGRYDYKDQNSTAVGEDYKIQQFMVKVGAEL